MNGRVQWSQAHERSCATYQVQSTLANARASAYLTCGMLNIDWRSLAGSRFAGNRVVGSTARKASVAALLLACAASAGFAGEGHPVVATSSSADDHELAERLPGWDETSGRKIATYPKTRAFDFLTSRIELDIPSMDVPQLQGRVTHTITPIAQPQTQLVLDCTGPVVRSVTVNGARAEFAMRRAQSWLGTFASLRDVEGEAPRQELVIALPSEAKPGQSLAVVIDYDLDFSANEGIGLTWHKGEAQGSTPYVHAQGQAELSSLWFPCFDSPSEFAATEIGVTVQDGFTVIANGTLQSRTSAANGRVRWQWAMPKAHAVYLTTVAIGAFEEVQVGGEQGARPGLNMPVWVPSGKGDIARTLFAQTAPIIAFFEETFDEPFAWPQYGQAVVPGFTWGGMENVGMTFYTPSMLNYLEKENGQAKADGLIAHETAHQWWGNLVTCKTWDDLWINEGWATFSEALWFEHAAAPEGVPAQQAAYSKEVRGWLSEQIRKNTTSAPQDPALVSNRFRDPDSTFVKEDNPYPKGALVLHMLRQKLGDRVFFAAARAFLDKHAGTPVETADLRKQFERTSGVSLERFFEQWTLRPGIARVQASATWNAGASRVNVSFEQVQKIDRWNPAYELALPIVLQFADGSEQTTMATFDTRTSSVGLFAATMPARVVIDPQFSQLAEVRGRVTVLDGSVQQPAIATPEDDAAREAAKSNEPVAAAGQ